MELEALQEVYGQIKELGASLIAISPQLSKYSKQVVNKNNITFPVLSDEGNRVAGDLGLGFVLPEKLQEVYRGFGIDLQRFNGDNSWVLPMPGRFVIDNKGIVRNTEVHPDHTVRPEPAEITNILKSIV